MNILCSELFETQLKELLQEFSKEDFNATKSFKLYLDTIILNMPTKATKYKKSIYFDDDNIRDIVHEDYTIPFLIDSKQDNYVVLSIVKNIL
jgi:toxin ParE1/3/4